MYLVWRFAPLYLRTLWRYTNAVIIIFKTIEHIKRWYQTIERMFSVM